MITTQTALVTLQDIASELQDSKTPTLELAAQIVHAARFVLEQDAPLERIKDTADTLKRARLYFEQHRATLAAVNFLAAEHIRLQWRLGNDLLRVPREQGTSSHDGTKFQQVINDLQIARSAAYRWQTLAQIDPQDLELYFSEMLRDDEPITLAGVLNQFTQKTIVDPREDADAETPEPPEHADSDDDNDPLPQYKRLPIVCRHCGVKDFYEVEI